MEENFFPLPAVAGELEQMIEARLHNDTPNRKAKIEIIALQEKLTESVATPIYLVMDPQTGLILGRRDGSLFHEEKFADFLRSSAEKARP